MGYVIACIPVAITAYWAIQDSNKKTKQMIQSMEQEVESVRKEVTDLFAGFNN